MATPLTKPSKGAGQPKRRAPTLDELRASRTVWCQMPSGHEFHLRPPNMELQMLAGGMPQSVRRLVTAGATELNELLTGEENSEANAGARDYFMHLVRLMVIEPDLSGLQDVTELDDVLSPTDFHFLLEIGQRERDTDAIGRQLWGQAPLSRWATFREFHSCGPDCPSCVAMQRSYSVAPVLG
jgi:hypothetical protein